MGKASKLWGECITSTGKMRAASQEAIDCSRKMAKEEAAQVPIVAGLATAVGASAASATDETATGPSPASAADCAKSLATPVQKLEAASKAFEAACTKWLKEIDGTVSSINNINLYIYKARTKNKKEEDKKKKEERKQKLDGLDVPLAKLMDETTKQKSERIELRKTHEFKKIIINV